MDDISFYIFLALFIFVGAVLGWVAFFRSLSQKRQLLETREELRTLRKKLLRLEQGEGPAVVQPVPPVAQAAAPEPVAEAPVAAEPVVPSPVEPRPLPAVAGKAAAKQASLPPKPSLPPEWLAHLKEHWMVWLGGVCVALAGVFLVRYSIEQGLLGPTARVVAGIVMGLGLHAGAEWLRRREGSHMAFAALAGGGSITLFAALLAALHLYELISPTTCFILLALVSLLSMALALLHGPVLAIIGILGAFLVPILVGGDSGSAHIVLGYTLVICAAALLLAGYVQRSWLWKFTALGGLIWWFLTLYAFEMDGWRGIYLAALALVFCLFPERDWYLQLRWPAAPVLSLRQLITSAAGPSALLPQTLLAIIVAFGVTQLVEGFGGSGEILNWLALPALLLWVAGKRASLALHAWVLLLLQVGALLAWRWTSQGFSVLDDALIPAFRQFCLALAAVYSGLALLNLRQGSNLALWVSLAVISPLLALVLSWLLSGGVQPSLSWSLLAVGLAVVYLALAGYWLKRAFNPLVVAWLIIGGHLGYSLAVSMYLREAGLSLALALQIISMAWVIRKLQLQTLDLVFKLVVMTVIARLSLNPWLVDYAPRLAWPLWVYGGATLCCFVGTRLLGSRPALQAWTGGAFIHLFALTLWMLLRHVLYNGEVFSAQYTVTEAALNLNLFAALGLIYHWRAGFSETTAALCRLYAKALLVLALGIWIVLLARTLESDPWVWADISARPIANLVLLAFGMPPLWCLLAWRFFLPQCRRLALVLASLGGFAFVSLEIMHLWRGSLRFNASMSDGELYTYSVVWLLLAVALLLGGAWRWGQTVYRAGLVLLCLVIAKLFLVDMAGLTGLLRVASFMGMGLALLAIAFLHQRLQGKTEPPESQS